MNYDALENTDVSGNGAGKIKHVGLLADKTDISASRLITTWQIHKLTSILQHLLFQQINE